MTGRYLCCGEIVNVGLFELVLAGLFQVGFEVCEDGEGEDS